MKTWEASLKCFGKENQSVEVNAFESLKIDETESSCSTWFSMSRNKFFKAFEANDFASLIAKHRFSDEDFSY
ncbi:hypothetical protein BY996DRAFT_6489162 [Phakopsora pachyrhizi]|nr:hypothetical protein BY996DRAFT_6489162 [Phakopsora pachyrhizi]